MAKFSTSNWFTVIAGVPVACAVMAFAQPSYADASWFMLNPLPPEAFPPIAVAANGTRCSLVGCATYAIGINGTVYTYTGSAWRFFAAPNPPASQIVANESPDGGFTWGTSWIVDVTGAVLQWNGNQSAAEFVPLNSDLDPPGPGSQFGSSIIGIAAAKEPNVYLLDSSGGIWEGDNQSFIWGAPAISNVVFRAISVDQDGTVYGVDSTGSIWVGNGAPNEFGQASFTPYSGGGVLDVADGPHIIAVGGGTQSIVDATPIVWGIDRNEAVRVNNSGYWQYTDGEATQVSIDPSHPGNVVVIGRDGNVYIRRANPALL